MSRTVWTIATAAGAVTAAMLARQAMDEVCRRQRGTHLPTNPAERGVRWREALVWGAATGAVAGVARVFGQRLAAGAVRRLPRRSGSGIRH